MKRIASVIAIAFATGSLATGCSTNSGAPENVGADEGGACSNLDGTNAMLASLATAIATELHRWEIPNDFEIYRGTYNQEMLRVKQLSRSFCSNSCRNVDAILALQDARNDQQFVFKDGTKLNSWTFASRLVAGYRNQATCQARASNGDPNSCASESHYLEKRSSTPATCSGVDYGLMMVTFKANKANQYGQKLNPEQPLNYAQQLEKKLLWAENGSINTNPYLQFKVTWGGLNIELDPGEGTGEDAIPPGSCGASTLKWSPFWNITGACCSVKGSTHTVYKPYAMPVSPPGWYRCQPR